MHNYLREQLRFRYGRKLLYECIVCGNECYLQSFLFLQTTEVCVNKSFCLFFGDVKSRSRYLSDRVPTNTGRYCLPNSDVSFLR